MTQAQLDALAVLAEDGRAYTVDHKSMYGGVNARAAEGLIALGYARRATDGSMLEIVITDAGRAAALREGFIEKVLHTPDDPPCARCPDPACSDYDLCRKKRLP